MFSLVLDRDVSPNIALSYPELYKELRKGRSLSYKTFFVWVLISIYQGTLDARVGDYVKYCLSYSDNIFCSAWVPFTHRSKTSSIFFNSTPLRPSAGL